jgi:hypothetical protein
MNSQTELTFLIGLYESNVGDDDPGASVGIRITLLGQLLEF